MENSERDSEIKGSAQVSEGFIAEDVPEITKAFDALKRAILYAKKEEEKFSHRLMPGKALFTIEELREHEWVYSLARHRAVHREALLSMQARALQRAIDSSLIREALEMTDQEVFDEKKVGNRAAYNARIKYRERLFDHASAIHDSVDGVSEDNDYTVVGEATGG